MKAKKLYRFSELKKMNNVFEYPDGILENGGIEQFKNKKIVLELACGKGEYAIGLAKEDKERIFIGMDIKGNRIFVGAKKALDEKIDNVFFVRNQIQWIEKYIEPKSVDEIWITFPDPFLRESKERKRLTHTVFLHIYQRILKPGGKINLKTDSPQLYQFTLEMIKENNCTIVENIDDVYKNGMPNYPLNIQTFYEKMHLEDKRTIHFVSFTLPEDEIKYPIKESKDEEATV
ncbi:MAG: tRNA (guanosine(46)-N7)-methyltransferase TrmB [Chitinophagaceae bacterium]|nr:tRNA (guanosine(46)-N7)-methyltransferase TrmB [Chitinophagaceae bacterium]